MKRILAILAALALSACANQSAWNHGANHVPERNDRDGPSYGAPSANPDTGIESQVTRATKNGQTTISWNEPLSAR